MNSLYEILIIKFIEKAQIHRDPFEVFKVLQQKYPDSNLPSARTFQRFFESETKHPRESTLGFMAAYILEIRSQEIESAFKDDEIGLFYVSFLETVQTKNTSNYRQPQFVTLPFETIKLTFRQKVHSVVWNYF